MFRFASQHLGQADLVWGEGMAWNIIEAINSSIGDNTSWRCLKKLRVPCLDRYPGAGEEVKAALHAVNSKLEVVVSH